MHLDYIEIGTSDFDTILQSSDLCGLSIDPLKIYLDRLPDKSNNEKINAAISNFDGKCEVFYIHPSDIEKYDLPGWIRGCNSVIQPHRSVIDVLKERGLEEIYKKESVEVLKWDTLIRSRKITSVDYLKIDTEGHDCVIINDIINSECNVYPKEIYFEANILTPTETIEKTLENLFIKGYDVISRDHENVKVRRKPLVGMNIDKVIFAVDDNPKYQGLWEIVSEICLKKLGVTPILFHITDSDSDFYRDKHGIVKKIKSVEGIKSGVQSQLVRMWGTRFFPDEVCLTSDIDMIMISKDYFIDQVKNIDREDLVIYCSDAYDVSREECVGIYGANRYPICYNAATGKTFNKILGTDCDFDSYISKVLSMGFPDFDSDEMYFGHKVNTKDHGVNIIKLNRGFYSKFKCPNRIDRVDDSEFNIYDLSTLKEGKYVDCHLARPYSRYEKEINQLRDSILSDKKEIYLIGCHIENDVQLGFLNSLVESLIDNGKDYVLSSHTMIPQELIEKSVGFIYDRENPKYKIWDLPGKSKYELDMGSFIIRSPYITYGRVDYYHVGPLRQLINGVNLIRTLDYDIIHWMDYDSFIDLSEEEKNVSRLRDYDFVFYGVGPKFSFNVKKFKSELFDMKSEDLLNLLSENEYVVEKVFSDCIIDGKKLFIPVEDQIFWGSYSQNFNEIRFDWSLFDYDNCVNIFIKNDDDREISFYIKTGSEEIDIVIKPNHWLWQPIIRNNQIGGVLIKWGYEGHEKNILLDLDLSNPGNYNNIVKSVDYIIK